MAVLSDLNALLGDNDVVLTLYIRKAVTAISNHLKTEILETDYEDAIIEFVTIAYNKRGNEGMKQFSQGSLSGTYIDDIPPSVKSLLPLPKLLMRG